MTNKKTEQMWVTVSHQTYTALKVQADELGTTVEKFASALLEEYIRSDFKSLDMKRLKRSL
ncbi:MAG: hypothetical protein AAB590_03955 [Patescibacteria group bacterium]